MSPRTVSFATLGCRLNQVDTRQLQTVLESRGFRTVPFGEPADVVVVNTCAVTARAEFSDRQAIRRAARVSPRARLVVTGCWAQTSPEDVARLGGVDLVVGNADKHRLPDLLDGPVAERIHVSDLVPARWVHRESTLDRCVHHDLLADRRCVGLGHYPSSSGASAASAYPASARCQ